MFDTVPYNLDNSLKILQLLSDTYSLRIVFSSPSPSKQFEQIVQSGSKPLRIKEEYIEGPADRSRMAWEARVLEEQT